MQGQQQSDRRRWAARPNWRALGAVALVGALLVVAVVLLRVYQHKMQDNRHWVERELQAVAQLQSHSVAAWYEQRRTDGALLMDDTLLARAAATWMARPTEAMLEVLQDRLRSLQERSQYVMVYLVDAQGAIRLTPQTPTRGSLPSAEQQALLSAAAQAAPQVLAPRKDTVFAFPFASVVVPLFEGARMVGGVWLVSDARTGLYPLLTSWPLPYETASTVLVQVRGEGLANLGPRSAGQAIGQTQALPGGNTVLKQAVRGGRGTLYGSDEDGHQVVSVASPVAGTDWLVQAQVQTSEVLAEVWWRELLALLAPVSLALLLVVAVFIVLQRRALHTEQALKHELQRNMLWLETAQRAAAMGYFVFDPQQQLFTLSSMAREIVGLPNQQSWTVRQWYRTLHPAERRFVLEQHRRAVLAQAGLTLQYRLRRPVDGAERWLEVWLSVEQEATQGGGHCFVGTVQDISARKHAEEELARYRATLEAQTRLDPLTQVANRRALQDHLLSEWSRAMRQKSALALLMLDVDCFKAYNDNYGHLAGDACLQRVAHCIQQCVGRSGDLVARFGGEEFVVVLPDTDASNAEAVAERIRVSVTELNIEHAFSCVGERVTLSVGLVVAKPQIQPKAAGEAPDVQLAVHELLKAADVAMYQAKQQGRNRVVVSHMELVGEVF